MEPKEEHTASYAPSGAIAIKGPCSRRLAPWAKFFRRSAAFCKSNAPPAGPSIRFNAGPQCPFRAETAMILPLDSSIQGETMAISDTIKKGIIRAPHRSLLRATGVISSEEDFKKPFIAVA